jgi:kinesin family protein C1
VWCYQELAAAEDFKSQLEAKETKLTVHASEAAAAAETALEAITKELGAQVEAAHAQGQAALEVVKEECEALTDQLAESEVRLEEVEEASAARTAELEADLATLQETALSNAEGAAVMVLDLKAQLESERTEAKELGDASAEVVKQLEADLEASTAKAEEEASTAASRIGQLEMELEGAVASANQTEAEGAEKVVALQEELASHKEQAASNQSEAAQTIAGLEGELSEARTLAEAASEESSGRISQLEAELEAQGQGAATAAEVHAREVGVLAAELSEVQAAAEENSLQASAQLRTVVSELEVTKAAAMEAAANSEACVTALGSDLERANSKIAEAVEAAGVAADKHTGALATAAEDLQAAVAVHVSEVGLLNGELESTRSEVAKLVEESAELQREKAALETESEERAELLIKYAAQVAEIVAAGEARVRDFENTIEGLNTGMAMAGEAAAETIAQKVAEMEEIKRQLFEAEEGRLQALARIEKAEMKADLSDAEADAQAKAAQVANTAKDVAQQKLDAALAHIQKIEAAKDAAEESEADAHAAAAQWKEEVDALQALRRKMHNEIVDLKGNIRVFCRIRPSKHELQGLPAPTNEASSLVVNPHPTNASGEVIDVFDGAPVGTDSGLRRYGDGKRHSFGFDKVFDGASTQDEVYAEVSPLVQSALDGYSLCIFAYGQTGSGKTHTMIGDTEVGDVAIVPAGADAEGAAAAVAAATAATEQAGLDRGIVYRACEQLFTDLNTPTSSGTWESTVTIEAVEIYNEKLRDLLPSKAAKAAATASGGGGGGGRTAGAVAPGAGLEIRKEPKTGRVYIEGIEAHPVTSCTGAVGFLDRALRQRATKATKCNDQSSRSHCVLIVRFAKTNVETGEVKAGALHFCDLAGSERLAKSGSGDDPALLREAQAINKSLSALGNTMSALVVGGRHVPFRDSRLTFLLQECFTGDGKSLLVCALSPEGDSVTESIGSLRFAQTVSQVTAATRQRCANCGEKTCSKGAKGDKKGAAEDEPNSGGSDKPPTKKRVR